MREYQVKSSNIDSVAYDPQTKELIIKFKNGTSYKYCGIDGSVVAGLLFADSIGKKFHDSIKIHKAVKI